MKLTAAAVSVVPLVLLWALARRLGASTAGAFLMVLIPTYTSRLSFAFLPSLFGHAVDMAFLLWIAGRIERVTERRTWLAGAAWVAACQLAYVSGVVNISLLVAVLAAVDGLARAAARGAGDPRHGGGGVGGRGRAVLPRFPAHGRGRDVADRAAARRRLRRVIPSSRSGRSPTVARATSSTASTRC